MLLTGEYFVLDGALALAVPTKVGQWLTVTRNPKRIHDFFIWRSLDENGELWFEAKVNNATGTVVSCSDGQTGETLQRILHAICAENSAFMRGTAQVETRLDFSRFWGLGSSSSLLYLLASWGKVNPFTLLEKTMGGSGYDVACAGSDRPLLYRLGENNRPEVQVVTFQPPFLSNLYLIYLGQKQNSREGIARYKSLKNELDKNLIHKITDLTKNLLSATELSTFETIIETHENIVSKAISLPPAKELLFSDYFGKVKSLGAWGGDFVLATSTQPEEDVRRYFAEKGYATVLPFQKLI